MSIQETHVSVVLMKSRQGWIELGQTTEFENFSVVLSGMLKVEFRSGEIEVRNTLRSAFGHSLLELCIGILNS